MAFRTRRALSGGETWAGFVDALSALLMVLIFALVVFMIAQLFQSAALTGQDQALSRLQARVTELADMLALERGNNADIRNELAQLSAELQQSAASRDETIQAFTLLSRERDALLADLAAMQDLALTNEQELEDARARIGLLSEDLDRAREDVTVGRGTLSLKLAELASLQRDLDALQQVRSNLEGEVGRMLLVLEQAQALQAVLENRLAGTEASLVESRVSEEELAAALVQNRSELERLALLLEQSRLAESETEQTLTERESELSSARERIDELIAGLSAVRDRSMELEARLSDEKERTLLAQREAEERNVRIAELTLLLGVTEGEHASAIELSDTQATQIILLNNQMTLLHDRLVSLNAALEAAEVKATRDQVEIAGLSAVRDRSMELEARLSDEKERTLLAQREAEERNVRIAELTLLLGVTEGEHASAIELSDTQATQIVLLYNQMTSLHDQLVSLNDALEAAEVKAAQDQVEIAGLSAVRDRSMELEARLSDEKERTLLAQREAEERNVRIAELNLLLGVTEGEHASAIELSDTQATQIVVLNNQMTSLHDQLVSLNDALEAAEVKAAQDQVEIAALGERLNAALAAKVQELSRFRSEFLEKLHDHLGNREDIKVVGDRFVIQSGVLFSSGSAEITEVGRADLRQISELILELIAEIPNDVDWILRVDGHTDTNPISTPLFPSNWELSTARATSVVRYLVSLGVPEYRLMAAGFGEFQPIDAGEDVPSMQRNRRIEFKLTVR